MATANLTLSRARELFHYDPITGILRRKVKANNGLEVNSIVTGRDSNGYLRAMVEGTRYRAHRLAWLIYYGIWPTHEVDHINGEKADNRIDNLRDIPKLHNMQNVRRANENNQSTGLLGATSNGVRFQARIRSGGKLVHLGTFDTPEEAHSAYVNAKRELHPGCTI